MPSALLGLYLIIGQWGDRSRMVDVWIDSSTTHIYVRNYNANHFKIGGSYVSNALWA